VATLRVQSASLRHDGRKGRWEFDGIMATESQRLIASGRLQAARGGVRYDSVRYADGDALMFGSETAGLPDEVLAMIEPAHRLRLPMRPGNRSLNLSNAVAVVAFEAWRQAGFAGGVWNTHAG